MGNRICSDTCRRKDEAEERGQKLLIHSLSYLTQFKSRKAIVDAGYMSFPLSTDGAKIVDAFGRRVKVCCYNLKGCHSTKACISALEENTIQDLAAQIKSKGFNTVIIPFSLDLYFENPRIEDQCLGPNDWMKGKKALQVLDITINGLTRAGLLVMLRNACSKASYFKEFTESDGLWWSEKYPEAKWIECLKSLTYRYLHNPRVFAIQLRHTIKSTPNYEPSWGTGNVLCDWKRATTLAGNQVLEVNPNIIVVITGDQRGDLRNIAESPLELKVKNKVVFAAKLKPFAEKPKDYQQLKSYIEESLNCIRRAGFPLILTTVTDRKQSDWKFIIDFLEQSDLDWGYSSYPKSPTKQNGHLFTNQQIVPALKRIQVSTASTDADDASEPVDIQEQLGRVRDLSQKKPSQEMTESQPRKKETQAI